MTYNPLKPDSGKSPALDASIIQTNFDQFAKIFSKNVGAIFYNHMPLNKATQGKHGIVLFQKQSADPGATQGFSVIYAKDSTSAAAATQPQLFVQIPVFLPTSLDPTTAPNDPMQLTYHQVNTVGPNQYQSFIAGGYIIYFGSVTSVPTTITVSPTPTALLAAYADAQNVGTDGVPLFSSTQIISANQFTINFAGGLPGSYKFSWFAIGTK